MNSIKRIIGIGLPSLGLVLGFLCLGRAVETALDQNPNRLGKRETITAGLLLGIPSTAGSAWMLMAMRRDRQLIQSRRLQQLFYKAVRANHGRINALQLAMLAEISVEAAQDFLDGWAGPLDADYQIDETGVMVYCFNVSAANLAQLDRFNPFEEV
ncbi:MAG: Protein of unknown function (DUF1601) [Phormidesmis priestleyi Ana]|uniref:Uncharacterized protein n=1 Tax=Phormidesmis priestleyi Ana TaxID=1666911 RepID=A0A0P7ZMN8_9CYAN|nr:MAG: Protein of unknown function (DUF1601) [Phormidesmis priestleyi Ana]